MFTVIEGLREPRPPQSRSSRYFDQYIDGWASRGTEGSSVSTGMPRVIAASAAFADVTRAILETCLAERSFTMFRGPVRDGHQAHARHRRSQLQGDSPARGPSSHHPNPDRGAATRVAKERYQHS